jgi:general secretion pathway protein K
MVLALLVFAISATLIVAMSRDFNRTYRQGSNIFLAAQSEAYLHGAEGLASLALIADADADRRVERRRDDLAEIWAQQASPYPLDEGGWLVGSLEDLQGRFNLNQLARRAEQEGAEARLTAEQAQFVRLLLVVTEGELGEIDALAITRAIGDWLDADNNLRPDGAEDDAYVGLTPAYRAANRPMASISELRAIAGIDDELFRALEPFVTVWPEQPGGLNVHTAPAAVLRSLAEDDSLQPLSASDGEALVAYREENGFADLDDFFAHPVFEGRAEAMAQTRTLLGETSDYFLLSARVEVADRNTRLYSVLERKNRQVNVLQRTTGSL